MPARKFRTRIKIAEGFGCSRLAMNCMPIQSIKLRARPDSSTATLPFRTAGSAAQPARWAYGATDARASATVTP
jgi:hypothetical protein